MDKDELQKKIALYYSKLPQKTQEFFAKMGWLETLQKISVKYALTAEQTEILTTETTLVLLGVVHPVEYEQILNTELNLPKDSAQNLFNEIENSILGNIRHELVDVFTSNQKTETGESVVPTSQNTNRNIVGTPATAENSVEKSNYKEKLYIIAKRYNLNVIQMGDLEKIVTDLILGKIQPDSFENKLRENVSLPIETIKELSSAINQEIFQNIRNIMIENSGRNILKETKNSDILKSAGIEIMPSPTGAVLPKAPTISTAMTTPDRGEMLKKIEKPEPIIKGEVHPILEQKMAKPFQIPMVKTDHSLDNITRAPISTESAVQNTSAPTIKKLIDIKAPVPQAPKAYPKGGDPYRINPNE